jgi:hypothetical protein
MYYYCIVFFYCIHNPYPIAVLARKNPYPIPIPSRKSLSAHQNPVFIRKIPFFPILARNLKKSSYTQNPGTRTQKKIEYSMHSVYTQAENVEYAVFTRTQKISSHSRKRSPIRHTRK